MIKQVIAVLLLSAVVLSAQQLNPNDVQCIPVGVVDASYYYIGYNHNAYKYSLPELNLVKSNNYEQSFVCYPATLNNNLITFGNDTSNSGSHVIRGADLTVASIGGPAPYSTPYYNNGACSPVVNNEQYCFDTCTIKHKVNGVVTESVALPSCTDDSSNFVEIDPITPNRLQVLSYVPNMRASTDRNYYRLTLSPLAVISGPVFLNHTGSAGCPVAPTQCGVPVLLDLHIENDIVSYVWSFAETDVFRVTVESYDPVCNQHFSTLISESSGATRSCPTATLPTATLPQTTTAAPTTTEAATTTIAPTTTAAPTTTQAVTTTGAATTTAAPTTTGAPQLCPVNQSGDNLASRQNSVASSTCLNNQSGGNLASRQASQCNSHGTCNSNNFCVCQSGWTGVDCQIPCVPQTTAAPTTTHAVTTTSAPITTGPINLAGNDNARSSGSQIVSMIGVVAAIAIALMI